MIKLFIQEFQISTVLFSFWKFLYLYSSTVEHFYLFYSNLLR